MVSPFVLRRYGAYLVLSVLPMTCQVAGAKFYGYWYSLIIFVGAVLLAAIIATMLLTDPFRKLIEGTGLLVLNIDSTGIISPFTVQLKSPYIEGSYAGHPVRDAYDRESVWHITTPRLNEGEAIQKDGGIDIHLNKIDLNKSRFGMWTYPVLIWNDQIKCTVTKDFIAAQEKTTFADHHILYLNRCMEDLGFHIRDFARYVVQYLKPKDSFFANKWFWIILVVGIGILLLLFGKPILQNLQGATTKGTTAISSMTGSGNAAIVPVNGGVE